MVHKRSGRAQAVRKNSGKVTRSTSKAAAKRPDPITGYGLVEYTIPADVMQDQFISATITGPDGTKAAVTLSFDDTPAFAIDFAKRSQEFTSDPRIMPGVEVRTDGGATAVVLLRLRDEAIVRVTKAGEFEPEGFVTSWPTGQLEPIEEPSYTGSEAIVCDGDPKGANPIGPGDVVIVDGPTVGIVTHRDDDAVVIRPMWDPGVNTGGMSVKQRQSWTIDQCTLIRTGR